MPNESREGLQYSVFGVEAGWVGVLASPAGIRRLNLSQESPSDAIEGLTAAARSWRQKRTFRTCRLGWSDISAAMMLPSTTRWTGWDGLPEEGVGGRKIDPTRRDAQLRLDSPKHRQPWRCPRRGAGHAG